MGPRRDPCGEYRVELALVATRREAVDPATWDHLGRCARCRAEVQESALASLALERFAEDVDLDAQAIARDLADEPVGVPISDPFGFLSLPAITHAATPVHSVDPTWLAVRRRATAARGPLFRWRGHLAGLIVGAGLAAVIIAPLPASNGASKPLYDSGTTQISSGSRDLADQKAEDQWLWANQIARKESPSVDIVTGPYDPSIFGEGPFQPIAQPSDIVGLTAR